jgi:hypothetical protein
MKVISHIKYFAQKTLWLMFYLHLGPDFYSKAYFPENSIYLLHFLSQGNLISTPSIKFSLGFKATFHFTLFTIKDLYFIEIIDIPLAFCTIHIKHSKHAIFTLKFSIYTPYYLDVTAFPPKKNLISRFGSRIESDDQIWGICWKESWEILLKIEFCFPSCFFFGMMIP